MRDPFILYFTSGTTGYPKPVTHDGSYPLAHIVTAKYWQNVQDGGLAPDRIGHRLGKSFLGKNLRPVALWQRGHGV